MSDIERRKQEAEAVGLTFIGPYQGVMTKVKYICPKHGEIFQTPNRVQQKIGCQKCGIERRAASKRLDLDTIRADAERVGIKYISEYISANRKAVYECPVHGLIKMRPTVVARGSSCRKCGNIKRGLKRRKPKIARIAKRTPKLSVDLLMKQAKAVGLIYADGYVPSHGTARYVCEEHGEIAMTPAVVRRGNGCRFCSNNVPKSEDQLRIEALKIGLQYIGPYTSDGVPTAYKCPQHGIIQKRPSDVKQGKHCAACAKYGFDPVAPATFYLYRVERVVEQSFIGYGLSKNYRARHIAHMATFRRANASASLIAKFELSSGRLAADLELHIQTALRPFHFDTNLDGFKEEAVAISEESRLLSVISDWMAGIRPT